MQIEEKRVLGLARPLPGDVELLNTLYEPIAAVASAGPARPRFAI